MNHYVELLSGAGNMEAAKAAISAGCDAIYLGLKDFSARRMADNFTETELENLVKIARPLKKKIYLTVNTIVKDSEMKTFVDSVYRARAIGCDAFIVQDIGIARLLNKIMPGIELHASTQMNIHNSRAFDLMKNIGIKRVVLSRECELNEIQKMCLENKLEIETFVYGALCSAISGICYMGSYATNRSGNRGLCPQMCRLKYFTDGSWLEKYMLSTRDLSLLPLLTEYYKAGVTSFKIEGRNRSASYIYNVTSAFRSAIDLIAAGKYDKNAINELTEKVSRTYNRTLCTGYSDRRETADVIFSERNSNYGLLIADRISGFYPEEKRIATKLIAKLSKNDLLEFETPEGKRIFIKITAMKNYQGRVVFELKAGENVEINYEIIEYRDKESAGQPFKPAKLFLVHSEEASSVKKIKMQETAAPAAEETAGKTRLAINSRFCDGVFKVKITAEGNDFEYESEKADFFPAQNRALDAETIFKTFLAFDHSRYSCEMKDLKVKIVNSNVFVPLSALKKCGKSIFDRFDADFKAYSQKSYDKIMKNIDYAGILENDDISGMAFNYSIKPAALTANDRPCDFQLNLFSDQYLTSPDLTKFDSCSFNSHFLGELGRDEAVELFNKIGAYDKKFVFDCQPAVFENETEQFQKTVENFAALGANKFIINNISQFEILKKALSQFPGRNFEITAGPFLNIINLQTLSFYEALGVSEFQISSELNHIDIMALLKDTAKKAPELLKKIRIKILGHLNTANFAYDFFRANSNVFENSTNAVMTADNLYEMAMINHKNGAHYIIKVSEARCLAYSASFLNMVKFIREYMDLGIKKFNISLFNYSEKFSDDMKRVLQLVSAVNSHKMAPEFNFGIVKDRILE